MTLDEAFKGSICVCSNWYENRECSGFPLGEKEYINLTYLLALVKKEPHSVEIKQIIISDWIKVYNYLQQEKLIKIENGKVTLLF